MGSYRVGDSTKGSSNSGGGDPNALKLEDRTKIRLIDLNDARQWRQHWVDDQNDKDKGQSVVCIGAGKCPLCAKNADPKGNQRFRVSRRFATNVYDYGSKSVKVLLGGPMIFDEFAEADDIGIDPLSSDWVILKTGTGTKTKYKLKRDDAAPFTDMPLDQLRDKAHDLSKYDTELSPEKIFEIIEKLGWDYDSLEGPSFTMEEALNFKIPFGKVKGHTVEQALRADPDWCEWFHDQKISDGEIQNPIFVALHLVMEDRGLAPPLSEVQAATESVQDTPRKPDPDYFAPAMVEMRGPDGEVQSVPEAAVEALVAAGYSKVEPEPEPEPTQVPTSQYKRDADGNYILRGADGTEVAVPDAAATAMIESGAFEYVMEEDPAEAEMQAKETPPEPVPDTELVPVQVGDATASMPFSAVIAAIRAGSDMVFRTPAHQEYANYVLSQEGTAAQTTQSPEEHQMHQEASEVKSGDPEKPFECEHCDKRFKTQGARTQHINRAHSEPEPEDQQTPPETAAAPSSNGNGNGDGGEESRDEVFERVKSLMSGYPTNDYQKLLDLFDEIAGERDISKFNVEQLRKLEQALTASQE